MQKYIRCDNAGRKDRSKFRETSRDILSSIGEKKSWSVINNVKRDSVMDDIESDIKSHELKSRELKSRKELEDFLDSLCVSSDKYDYNINLMMPTTST